MKYNLFKGRYCFKALSFCLLLFFTVAPVIYIFIRSLIAAVKGDISIDFSSGGLLLKSVLLYLFAIAITMLLGLLSAICVWIFFEKKAIKITLFILLLILIPPFIHVQSWIFFADKVNGFLGNLLGIPLNFNGVFAVIVTTSFSYLPITTGFCLLALLSIPPEVSDLCLIDGGGKKTFFKIYLPLVFPLLLVSGLLVFLLNINDYSIASVFGINVFVLELYALFSAGTNLYRVFFAGIPQLIICVLITAFCGYYMKESNFSFSTLKGKNLFKKEKLIKTAAVLGFIILSFFVIVPLFNLLYEAFKVKGAITVLFNCFSEISYSFYISILTALLSIIPAIFFAYTFYKSKARVWLLWVVALPFIIPSPIAGLSLIQIWNMPLLSFVYQSSLMPAIALISRFTFIEAIILSVSILRIDKALIENMTLHYPGFFNFFICITLLIWKECLAGVLIVFALSIGEFGVTLLVTPPGYQTLTIKIYNYLHYGASEIVAVLCLFMLVVMMSISYVVFLLLTGDKNE